MGFCKRDLFFWCFFSLFFWKRRGVVPFFLEKKGGCLGCCGFAVFLFAGRKTRNSLRQVVFCQLAGQICKLILRTASILLSPGWVDLRVALIFLRFAQIFCFDLQMFHHFNEIWALCGKIKVRTVLPCSQGCFLEAFSKYDLPKPFQCHCNLHFTPIGFIYWALTSADGNACRGTFKVLAHVEGGESWREWWNPVPPFSVSTARERLLHLAPAACLERFHKNICERFLPALNLKLIQVNSFYFE